MMRGMLPIMLLAATGCGTVCNLAGGVAHPDKEPMVYGGVIRDLDIIDSAINGGGQINGGAAGKEEAALVACIVAIAVGDPIISFVADTITLPITIPLQERRIAREKD